MNEEPTEKRDSTWQKPFVFQLLFLSIEGAKKEVDPPARFISLAFSPQNSISRVYQFASSTDPPLHRSISASVCDLSPSPSLFKEPLCARRSADGIRHPPSSLQRSSITQMSFGDISPVIPPQPSSLFPPAISELQRLLKPLAANNAALRQATTRLDSQSPDAPIHLKRIRALREQNRQIARAAATISSNVDFQLAGHPGHEPHVIEKANHAKSHFQTLLDDFSNALKDSVNAERSYVDILANPQQLQSPSSQHQPLSETQVAIEQEKRPFKAPSEKDPLLPQSRVGTQRQEAALREVQTNNALVEERRAVLADVQSSIDDVNAIFKDLAVMISDQRTQVEHVEIAVSETAHNVAGARRELEKTKRRREGRKRFFFVTLLSIAGIIALFLIFLLS